MCLWDISTVFWGFSAMEGQAEILMNYLSHQVLVNDLSQIQFPVYKEGCRVLCGLSLRDTDFCVYLKGRE